MELRRIEVQNIRSYETATLDLGPGTTLVVGDVGSGKTSLLYAVEMALFGTAEVDATYLIRHGAGEASVRVVFDDDGHAVEIERQFRRVKKRGREGFEPGRLTFRVDGAATQYSATELRQRVIERLGFRDNPNPRAHSDVWRWAVYVPQEQMREILAAPPLERLATVRRALGVERYHLAAENAKEVARDLRQTSTALRGQAATLRDYADDRDPARAEAARLETELAAGRHGLAGLEETARSAHERVEAARRAIQALASDRERLLDLTRAEEAERRRDGAIAARRRQIGTDRNAAEEERIRLEAAVGALPVREELLRDAAARLAAARTEVERLSVAEAGWVGAVQVRTTREAERQRAQGDLARAERELAGLRADLAVLEQEGGTTEPQVPEGPGLSEVDAALTRARLEEQEATAAVALAQHLLGELRELIAAGVCPRCRQPVRAEEFGRHEAEAVRALEVAEARRAAGRSARTELEARRIAWEAHARERAAWEARAARRRTIESAAAARDAARLDTERRLAEISESLAAAAREVEARRIPPDVLRAAKEARAAAEEAHRAASTAVEEARRAIDRRSALADRLNLLAEEDARLASELRDIGERAAARRAQIAEGRERLETEPARRAELAAAEGERERAERARLAQIEGVARLGERVEEAHRRATRAEAAAAERDRLTREAETVESKAVWLATAFHDAVLTMEKRVLEQAQADFEQTFRRYFAALMGDPDLVAVTDATFSPSAEIRGVATPAEALSGGERTSLALAYRLALSRVVRALGHLRLDTLLLDEPTDGFSPEQVGSMGELLERLELPQVVLVSHERELESIADRVVVVEKTEGTSVLRESGRGDVGPPDGAAPTTG